MDGPIWLSVEFIAQTFHSFVTESCLVFLLNFVFYVTIWIKKEKM